MAKELQLSDEHLYTLVNQDKQNAYQEIYERYKVAMLVYAAKRVPFEVAEDLVQDIFVKLWNNRFTVIIEERIAGYLFKALRNKILDFMDRDENAKKYINSLDDFSNQYSYQYADEKIRSEHFLNHIQDLLRQYGPQYQKILHLRMAGYSNQEIADELGLSEKTIRNNYSSILKIIRSKFSNVLLFLFF